MAGEARLPLWEATEHALDHAKKKYGRRLNHRYGDTEAALATVQEIKVTVQIQRSMTQLLTFQFTHRVVSRSFIYYYSLRRQHNDTYTIYDVETSHRL